MKIKTIKTSVSPETVKSLQARVDSLTEQAQANKAEIAKIKEDIKGIRSPE